MIPESLEHEQQAGRLHYLAALHERCARRFREAARLIGEDLARWPALAPGAEHRARLDRLQPFWHALCDRYNSTLYDPQPDMLRRDETPESLFSSFVYWRFFPVLMAEHECLRNVLRAAGTLRSGDPVAAGNALALAMWEWPLSSDMRRPLPGCVE